MKTAAYLINYAFREHSDMILFKTQLILIFLMQFCDKKDWWCFVSSSFHCNFDSEISEYIK